MARMYAAVCKDCRHEFEFQSGGLMTCVQMVCDKCCHTIHVPRSAPTGSYEISERGLREYLQSDRFALGGREFTKDERHSLNQLTSSCSCGGKMVYDDGEGSVKHKCPKCRSANLDVEMCGMAD